MLRNRKCYKQDKMEAYEYVNEFWQKGQSEIDSYLNGEQNEIHIDSKSNNQNPKSTQTN